MELGIPAAFGDADTMSQGPPFCASGGAVDLDAATVDEELVRHAFDPGELDEDPF
ncbi:MAG: hypothetical protein ACOY4C_00330 [Pseudomonadota bacterium]